MSRIHRIDRYTSPMYLAAYLSAKFYSDEGDACCDVELEDVGFSLIYPGVPEVGPEQLTATEVFMSRIVELEGQVPDGGHSGAGMEFQLSYINVGNDVLEFRYQGINVNAEWSAFFRLVPGGSWSFHSVG